MQRRMRSGSSSSVDSGGGRSLDDGSAAELRSGSRTFFLGFGSSRNSASVDGFAPLESA